MPLLESVLADIKSDVPQHLTNFISLSVGQVYLPPLVPKIGQPEGKNGAKDQI
jgi:hypothetical protein